MKTRLTRPILTSATVLSATVLSATVLSATGLVTGCQSEAPPTPPAALTPGPVPGVALVDVTVSPLSGPPGTRLTVTARTTAPAPLSVFRPERPSALMGAPTEIGGVYTSVTEVLASDQRGLQVLGVQGLYGSTSLLGYTTFLATDGQAAGQPGCPVGSQWVGGACVPSTVGHAIEPSSFARVSLGHPSGAAAGDNGERLMLHPRQVVRVGGVTLGCHTDHVGIIRLDDYTQASYFQPGGTIPQDLADRQGVSRRTETVIRDVLPSLSYCENFTYLPALQIGVTGHRGTGTRTGGLVTWRFDTTRAACAECEEPFPKPTLLDSHLDDDGFEGLALDGRRLYAAQKPNNVAIYDIGDDGRLTLVSKTPITGMSSAWNVALDGHWLYVTDPSSPADVTTVTAGPNGTNHYGHTHTDAGGRVFAIDVSDASAPKAVGFAVTQGAAKGVAVLPNDVVAVASGTAGIELFDMADHTNPTSLWSEDTPGTANDLSYAGGLLLVADWDALRLYDASSRGVLALVDATDTGWFADLMNGPPGSDSENRYNAAIAMGWAHLESDGTFLATEIDRIYAGTVAPGATASRVLVHDSRKNIRTGPGNATADLAVRVSNGSRTTAWATVETTPHVSAPSGGVVLAPGESRSLEVRIAGLDGDELPKAVTINTSDSLSSRRLVALDAIAGQYEVGDPAPLVALPGINWCDESGCALDARCVTTNDSRFLTKPIVMAIFSSW